MITDALLPEGANSGLENFFLLKNADYKVC
jgi:hypothetical protein